MNLARVIGTVWATQKDPAFEGKRCLLIQPLTFQGEPVGDPKVALDSVQAGSGAVVLYVSSREASIPFPEALLATDATIVGIVDRVDCRGRHWSVKAD